MAAPITVTLRHNDACRGRVPDHWIGNPPTQFRNPWPSFRHKYSLKGMLRTRFGPDRNFVTLPQNRSELVAIQTPDWGVGKDGAKATWIGHSSFLVETTPAPNRPRGVRLLLDPVFCDRMGPGGLLGPRRFSQTPCGLEDVPETDVVCISHNHYDHLDINTIKALYFDDRRKTPVHFFCGLGTGSWLLDCGIQAKHITEMDWWDEAEVAVQDIGSILLACTPSQHGSRRGLLDENRMLWCSFVMQEQEATLLSPKHIFFAGDTGYRSVTEEDMASGRDEEHLPRCPAFKQIGERYGPFDLALLPIGCYSPRTVLSGVHCTPEDSIAIHVDLGSKRSLGMHYGTLRGSLSAHYEDVREPARRWKAACIQQGLRWDEEILLCNIGETVVLA